MARLVLFCHSLRSDWNHGNAHFLRGVLSECQRRGIPYPGADHEDFLRVCQYFEGSSPFIAG